MRAVRGFSSNFVSSLKRVFGEAGSVLQPLLLCLLCGLSLPEPARAQGTGQDFFPLYIGMTRSYAVRIRNSVTREETEYTEDSDAGLVRFTILSRSEGTGITRWQIRQEDSLLHRYYNSRFYWTVPIDTSYMVHTISTWEISEEDSGMHELSYMGSPRHTAFPWVFPVELYGGSMYMDPSNGVVHRYPVDKEYHIVTDDVDVGGADWYFKATFKRNVGLLTTKANWWIGHNPNKSWSFSASLIDSSAVDTVVVDSVRSDTVRNVIYPLTLGQNYPNPIPLAFSNTTAIVYSLPEACPVKLDVCDAYGRTVETLVDAAQPAGLYHATFDASRLSSGVYFYQLKAGDAAISRRMLVLK